MSLATSSSFLTSAEMAFISLTFSRNSGEPLARAAISVLAAFCWARAVSAWDTASRRFWSSSRIASRSQSNFFLASAARSASVFSLRSLRSIMDILN